MFRSKKSRILTGLGALALVVVVSGFALSRGYLMRFNVNDVQISRDAFLQLAEEVGDSPQFELGCAQGELELGWFYIYEINCFDTQEAVTAYMQLRYPR